MNQISLDLETRSRVSIKKCGEFRYAEDPSTEILIAAVSLNRTPCLTWDIRQKHSDALDLLRDAITHGWEIHAFNSQFEWAHLKYVFPRQFGMPIPNINQMRCSSALARSAGCPPSLAAVAEFLKLPVQKDKMGAALIQKFSVPQKGTGRFIEHDDGISFTAGGEKLTAAAAFQKFVDYCVRDVETEQAVATALKPFEMKGAVLEAFLATARINDRGVPVHREALIHAQSLVNEHEVDLTKEFRAITGLNPKQNAKNVEWLQARGYKSKSLAVASREDPAVSSELTAEGRKALNLIAELSYVAVKKLPAMLGWIMEDGFIRGSFIWCGAQKTWRWTSKGVQWQNCKKPSKKLRPRIEEIFQSVVSKTDLEIFGFCYGDPYEVLASLIRYFVRFKDKKIYDLDFSAIEAKILPQIIECQRILDTFSSEEDIYIRVGKVLTIALKDKFKVDLPINRDTGKTIVLATQFNGGWNAVFNATGKSWEKAWCLEAVRIVRKENPEFREAWDKFQVTFITAMERPDQWHPATKYVSFGYTEKAPFPRMLMKLPAGRKIVYPFPKKDPITMVKLVTKDDHKWHRLSGHLMVDELPYKIRPPKGWEISSSFQSHELSFHGHVKGKLYGRVNTSGGDLLQSATQGTGVDLLASGVIEAEKVGFEPFFLVHDQCLTPAEGSKEQFTQAMCLVPAWFAGFPLDAETDTVLSYCKS